MNAVDPVQAVAEVLGCKRVTDRNGTAYCAEHNFGWLRDVNACPRAERAAEVVLAAARPAIEREAKAAALVRVRRYAEGQAITAKAQGRDDRDWLDLLIILDQIEREGQADE